MVDDWSGRPVLVVGDPMLDDWHFTTSERLCREAPAPVLRLRDRQLAAGGAANTAVNLAALGGRSLLVAPVGADAGGDRLRDCLERAGVTDRTVTQPGRPTPVKRRLLADDQIVLREDEGDAAGPLPDDGVRRLLRALRGAVEEFGPRPALVICDYGLGALPEPARAWLVANRELFGTVTLDAHDLRPWRGLAPSAVTPSLAEAAHLLRRPSRPGDRAATAAAWLPALRERTGAAVVAVTLDSDGAIVGDGDGQPHRTHADPAAASHAVGAGDAYLAALTLALAAAAPTPLGAETAQLAAAVTLGGPGTCVCDRDALFAAADPAVTDAVGLAARVRRRRAQGDRVVFTNGCFDVLHRGHVRYLEQAAALGDVLVVAVNSDESVRRLKGPDRPVNPVEDRVAVLAALSCVDHVVVFEEDSPADLIATVRPEVYVKGGDYPPELVPEAPLVRRLGGQVHCVGYVPDRSTSAIIDRIRADASERAPSGTESDSQGPLR
ncbi:rfaE bifunctional protein, domain I/rfaE bifunctional protein, domain II [Micromonospora pattaloongensis]|uniref:D-glycero-beta-D-manno-heptose 1-phosphate adenylyltransferase n=2 Tax=Micromonospora pattaloongensis TaxID=405436 RepID=A0A1H3SMF4_9ACTN|nr:rfaE bifunctional protein, domain I/rfaE bifunctional protein, domain II [Micromonospora pattaloongensis]